VTVVLLHALPLDERMWEPNLEALAEHEVIAPRLYDLGSSMEEWARAVLERLEGLFVVVGASMGGYCALALARLAPERVQGLVLSGSRPDADSPERRTGRADTIRQIQSEGAAGLWESMRPKLFPDDADPAVVERARLLALDQQPEGLVRAVEAIRDRGDSTEALRLLGHRAVVVLGDRDPFVAPDEVDAADIRVLAGCGHLPSLQRPDEFNVILQEVLERWT
jgi:pimeloyl-[acyl-carrier protein] methyl ester esterase